MDKDFVDIILSITLTIKSLDSIFTAVEVDVNSFSSSSAIALK